MIRRLLMSCLAFAGIIMVASLAAPTASAQAACPYQVSWKAGDKVITGNNDKILVTFGSDPANPGIQFGPNLSTVEICLAKGVDTGGPWSDSTPAGGLHEAKGQMVSWVITARDISVTPPPTVTPPPSVAPPVASQPTTPPTTTAATTAATTTTTRDVPVVTRPAVPRVALAVTGPSRIPGLLALALLLIVLGALALSWSPKAQR